VRADIEDTGGLSAVQQLRIPEPWIRACRCIQAPGTTHAARHSISHMSHSIDKKSSGYMITTRRLPSLFH
jgi:hypothetical protein